MTNIHRLYQAPDCEYDGALLNDLICQSPVEGGLEGTGEEDWTL